MLDSFSEDETYKLIKNLIQIKLLKNKLQMKVVLEGLNNAYKLVSGKFIILLHSGDLLYSPQTLEKVKKNISDQTDLIICNCIFFDNSNKVKRIWEISNHNLNLDNCYNIPHTTSIMKVNLVNEIGYYNLNFKIASDTEYILRIFKKRKINYILSNDFLCFMKLGGLSTVQNLYLKRLKKT